MSDLDAVVIGAGAAGIAAARTLHDAGANVMLVEARDRLGGRAFTQTRDGWPIDLGCGWLHSAPENEWGGVARTRGYAIDFQNAPWKRGSLTVNFSATDQRDFAAARDRFDERLDAVPDDADCASGELLEPGGRWNALLDAVSTFANGVELSKLSAIDFRSYRDTGINWRIVDGYGTLIAAHAESIATKRGCAVKRIDHSGTLIRLETSHGTLAAKVVVVTVPTSVLADGDVAFHPALPDKTEAAAQLPLGLADKLFLHVDRAEDLPLEARLMGATDRVAMASYHLRPFGRPMIEGYFGGENARRLEAEGDAAFAAFATDEICAAFGSDFRNRLRLLAVSGWHRDPFARGSYSYARIGHAAKRAALAAPVDERLFFAGEATSTNDFSTAHGAYRTGVRAAKHALHTLGLAP